MNEQIEEWKDVPYNPIYEVSSLGKVRNKTTGRILKPSPDRQGYYRVILTQGAEIYGRRSIFMHRIMGELYVPNDDPINKKLVTYKDSSDLSNYSINNLLWASSSDAIRRSMSSGRIDAATMGKAGGAANAAKSSIPVHLVYEDGTPFMQFPSRSACAKFLKISMSMMSRVIKGELELVV